ncbi:MAG TPA: multidrug efflux RND transporter permease subunit [Polyangia bacterium]|nr:multidrug efflux RND transporter permease subunit [Polyangia bacterium]
MSAFFVRRPIVAIVISIVLVITGVVVMSGLPIDKFPPITPPQVNVSATYVGADAVTVEQAVATPIEQQMNGVDRMIYMQSINAADGTMSLRVTFEVGTSPDIANVLAQNRVSWAQARLPASVNAYGLITKKTFASPLLAYALYSPHGSYDNGFLANYATINLTDELLRVKGVGDVRIVGGADYAMRVWINPEVLANYGLTIADLMRALQRQSTVNPAGQLGAEPVPKGQEFTYTIRAKGRLTTAAEFDQIIVRANPDGSYLRMKDVARLELGTENYNSIGRYSGKNAAVLLVYQLPGSNALAVADEVKRRLATARARFPADMDYAVGLDSTAPIIEGMREIVVTLLEALALVIVVVFVFLQSWRATLIPLCTVPVSLIGTFILFPLFGFSLNTLSLFGLVLAIGLVVDDAIVVVEAVEHHIEEGMSPREATLQAMREVSGPVVAIALVLSSVFIPVAFVVGIKGRLFQQFALTIAISVLISAFNALTLSPALSALLLKPKGARGRRGPLAWFFARFNRAFAWTTDHYVGLSARLLRKTVVSLVVLALFALGGLGLGRKLPQSFVPDEDQGFLYGNLMLPDAASLQRTDAAMKKVEEVLSHVEGLEGYTTISGFSILTQTTTSNQGLMFLAFKPWSERRVSTFEVLQKVNRALATIPEGRAFAFPPPAILGIGTSGGFDVMLEDRVGMSVDELDGNAKKFMAALGKRREVTRLNNAFRAAVPQLFARVDEAKALKQGVDLADIYATLGAFMGGSYINDFNRFGRQWRVFLEAEGPFRQRADEISRFYVRNARGEMVPLSTMVTIEETNGPQFTSRFNLFRSAEITGQAAPGFSSGQAMAAVEEVAAQTLPKEMSLGWAGLSFQERAAGGVGGVLALSLLLVFLILAALYESWSLPWSVLLSTPVALFGALLGLFIRKMSLDVYGQIGLIMLVGLAAKNAILIVEFARSRLESSKEHPIADAALEAARLRLRPILMTSFAFIFGMLPLVVASGAGGVSRRELGSAVVVGLIVATLFGIFLVPTLFAMVERVVRWGSRRRTRRALPAPSGPSSPSRGGPSSPSTAPSHAAEPPP